MTEMKRRGFLAAVLAATVAGTLGTNSALARAPVPDLEPIAETIRQYQEMVSLHNAHRENNGYLWKTPKIIQEELTQRFDRLLGYMMQEFSSCPCSREDVRAVFNNQPLLLTTEYLESVVRGTIPLVMARNVLSGSHQGMMMRPSDLTNWKPFCAAYMDKIPLLG